mgnify:CR=1 FL=1
MALTPGQQKCVDTFVGPLSVSAGAGSGKTYTLTRRIVNAFETGFIDDIGQVLAITFTSKAAGEIKSRVKGALKASGRSDQALLVDSAWISTIHGACSRILRAHALELGINPAFKVADEAAAKTMLDESLEEVLGVENDLVSPCGFDGLFEEYGSSSSGSSAGSSVADMVRALVASAGASPNGISSLVLPPPVRGVHRLASDMVDVASAAIAVTETQKTGKSRDAFLENSAKALEALESALAAPDLSNKKLLGLFNGFPVPTKRFGTPEYKVQVDELAQEYRALAAEARLGLAEPHLGELVQLANLVFAAYTRRKREAGLLDNDDLLTCASRMFVEHPEVAADYTDRFKLIMIDEFQDTDQMQVDMIKRMAGKRLERLCTVGDAQQSIYRFRGADVSVYHRHVQTVEQSNAEGSITLSDNFRSHVDVLAFVDRIFSQPAVFGRSFMSLSASRDEARVKSPYRGDGPRVEVQLTTYAKGVPSDDARRVVARRIAERFAELRAAGQSVSDMVVLLGTMRYADVFADALRKEGLPCVVSGGSIFSAAPEVQLMVRLAEAIANPKDTEALFEVLSSELFSLSADDFIALSTRFDEQRGIPRRVSLDGGVRAFARDDARRESASPALAQAMDILSGIESAVGIVRVSAIMRSVVLDSGWLGCLEAGGPEGLARAANVYKAIRMVEDIESEKALGPAGIASEFRLRVEVAKEAPGALSATSGDFVRIMTIHASKGLEFPVVAIAELRSDASRARKLACTSIGGKTYLSLDAGDSLAAFVEKESTLISKGGKYDPFAGDDELDEEALERIIADPAGHTAAEIRAAIKEREQRGEAQESKRLLYVAITRAKEAVICAPMGLRTKTHASGLSKSAWCDVESALVGEENAFEPGVSLLDFGGEAPARVEWVDLSPEQAEGNDAGETASPDEPQPSASSSVSIPAVEPFSERPYSLPESARAGVHSYSSLAKEAHGGSSFDADEPEEDETALSGEEGALPESDGFGSSRQAFSVDADKATDLGAAFHRLAQHAVVSRVPGSPLVCPQEGRIDALCRAYRLTSLQVARLHVALRRWFESGIAQKVGRYRSVRAEVPFFMQVGKGEGAPFLEGQVDLLADDGDASSAFVVDYKTGGSPLEDAESLRRKHELQAKCYAYAVLAQGFERVDLAFVRVEQHDESEPGDEPEAVSYSFEQDDFASLEQEISSAIARSASR